MKSRQFLAKAAIIVAATAAFASAGHAQEATTSNATGTSAPPSNGEATFGQRGQWYLYAPSLLGYHRSYPETPLSSGDNGLQLGMELGTFVRDHFSVGLGLDGSYAWQRQQVSADAASDRLDSWSAGLKLVVGWQRSLSSWVSFWPKIALGGSYASSDQYAYDLQTQTPSKRQLSTYSIGADARLPLVLHVTRHLFVELAYETNVTVWRGDVFHSVQVASGQTTLGLGGWF